MRLKQSEARNAINKIKENLKIEIESFFDVAEFYVPESDFLSYEILKFCFKEDKISDFLKDESIKAQTNKHFKNYVQNYTEYTHLLAADTNRPQKFKDDLLNKMRIVFQFSDLYKSNIGKFVLLGLIERFETIEYLSYSLSEHSLGFFKKQFDVEEIYNENKNCFDIGNIHFIFSKHYFENFIAQYEEFKMKYENEVFPKNIVLEAMLNNAKETISISNFIELDD